MSVVYNQILTRCISQYGTGEMEFESYMRMLDAKGVNTGYPYKSPAIFKDQIPTYPNVQYPPIVPGMDGPPSDIDPSGKPNPNSKKAWFQNPNPVEQRISPPLSDDSRRKPGKVLGTVCVSKGYQLS